MPANCPLCGQFLNQLGQAPAGSDVLANIPDEPQGLPLNSLRGNPNQLFGGGMPMLGFQSLAPQLGGVPNQSGQAYYRKLFGL